MEISQSFVAFSEYMNFKSEVCPATNTAHTYMVEVTIIGYVETSTIQSYTLVGKIVSRKTL